MNKLIIKANWKQFLDFKVLEILFILLSSTFSLSRVKIIAWRDSIRGRLLLYFMRDKTQINQRVREQKNKN